jgi:anti-sigma regulatory factor (Ser/Thr protein kinase)
MVERGRGLFLVRALVDQLDSDVVNGHTRIRALRRSVVAGAHQP